MRSPSFAQFAGACAFLVSIGAVVYAALFVSIVEGNKETEPWFAILLVGALLTVPVMIGVYQRLRTFDEGFALLALVLALAGALGGVLHGGYELAAIVTPPEQGYYPGVESVAKGVLRYFVAGLALLLIAWLIMRSARLPRMVGNLAAFGGVLLIVIYFGRLFDFITPGDYASLIPPILYGFVVHPLLYGLLGLALWRETRSAPERAAV